MSDDDLRTRIAAVIRREVPCHPPAADRIAAVVIRELGLRRASRPNDYQHVNYPPGDRYITDWLTDDE